MIIVRISGGLGNQLFQYAFAQALSELLDVKAKYDIKTRTPYAGYCNRNLNLESWGILLDVADDREILRFRRFKGTGTGARAERFIIKNLPFLTNSYYIQRDTFFEAQRDLFTDNCYYDGYWQSEKYFERISYRLRNDLVFKGVLSSDNKRLSDSIQNQKSVSIHVRRTDYINNRANRRIFATTTMEYYRSAIEYLSKRYDDLVYYVFADDMKWAMENLHGKEFIFIDGNYQNPEVDMYLMTLCKSNIIANSTFSWWGAWLNRNPQKSIIAPKQWFRGTMNNRIGEIIPKEWTLI